MAIHFNSHWYETIVAATKELTKKLDSDTLDMEYNILFDRLLDSPEENKDYFKATGKYAINLSKTLATREHLTIYKEEVKRELYSLVINARTIIEKELNPKIKLKLDYFFKARNLSYTDDDLTQLLFNVLVTLSTHLLDNNDFKRLEKKTDNYISLTKSIAQNIIESIKLGNILKKSNPKVRKEQEIAYLKLIKNQTYIHSQTPAMTLDEEKDLIELGSTLLEIFLNLNLIKSEESFDKNKTKKLPRKMIIISLTEAGKRLLSKKKKIDYEFYKRLPLLHPAYPITTKLQGNQHILDISNLNDQPTNFVPRRHGVTIDFNRSDLSVIQNSVNYLTSTPYSINFWLFCQYQSTYFPSFVTLNKQQKTLLKTVSKGCRFYLPNPLQKKTDKARCNYVFQKIYYTYFLGAILSENLSETETDNNFIKNLKHDLKTIFKEKNFEKNLTSYKQANKIRFYITRFFDWRLRIYEYFVYLYSGSQFERSLITASINQPLKNSFELIANAAVTYYGKYPKNSSINTTKLSWNDKLKIFRDNMAYYKDNKRYKFAKKKFLFTALIEKLNEAGFWEYFSPTKNNALTIEPESNLVIALDNTASGFQILTLLTGSENNNLNLCAQNADSRIEDCYGNVAKIVREILLQESTLKIILETNILNFIRINQILFFEIAPHISRALLKLIMMPYFYGITKRTIFNKIRAWLKRLSKKSYILKDLFEARDLYFKYKTEKETWEKHNLSTFKSEKISQSEFDYYKIQSEKLIGLINTISTVSLTVISTIYPKIELFFRTLRVFAATVSYFQQPITWRPVGSNIILEQTYKKYVISQFTLPKRRKRGRIKRVTLKELSSDPFDSLNKEKAKAAFPANFIQSIDASILHVIIAHQRKFNYVTTTLHDNFVLTPCFYNEFYSMYTQKLCEIFGDENIISLFNSLPKPEIILNNYLKLYQVDSLLKLKHGKKALKKYNKLLESYTQLNICLLGLDARKGREELFKGILNSRHILTP